MKRMVSKERKLAPKRPQDFFSDKHNTIFYWFSANIFLISFLHTELTLIVVIVHSNWDRLLFGHFVGPIRRYGRTVFLCHHLRTK